MESENSRVEYLFGRYVSNLAKPEEKTELAKLIAESDDQSLRELFSKTWTTFESDEQIILPEKRAFILHNILGNKELNTGVYHIGKAKKIEWIKRIAVAASILLAVGVSSYFFFFNKKDKQTEIANTTPQDVKAPETNRAMITLANGSKIYLDSVENGKIGQQGVVIVTKTAEGILYTEKDLQLTPSEPKEFNILTNPRGSRVVNLKLADGSRVWLNAGSSVTYPVAFTGKERKISITGEAYFEITPDASKPFVVSKGETSVTVLGTHFNVNAYDDETSIKVTLLEGSVKVSNKNRNELLKPGQQAQVSNSINMINGADLDEVMAWKNGRFVFADAGIKTVMNQVARWYDVEIVYEGKVTKTFKGGMPRNLTAANVFRILEETGGVHFKIEGKKVTVMP